MTAQVHLASRRKSAHREFGRTILLHERRLAVAQLGSHLLHQPLAREITVKQHHTRRISAEGLTCERVNNEVPHDYSTITVRVV